MIRKLRNSIYHVEKDKTLRIVPPEFDWKLLFEEVHIVDTCGMPRCTECCQRSIGGLAGRVRLALSVPVGMLDKLCIPHSQIFLWPAPSTRLGWMCCAIRSLQRADWYAIVLVTKWPEVFATPGLTTRYLSFWRF